MGQILTKVAIVLSGLIFCFMNPVIGIGFMAVGLFLSSARDAKLARRRQKRMLPGFGAVWFLGFSVMFAFLALVSGLGGVTPMSLPTATLCVTFAAIWVRIISILVEGGVRGLMELLLGPLIGWDNIELDQAQVQLDNGTWGQVQCPGRYPPNYTGPQNWGFNCPVCGAKAQFAIDVCWDCSYGHSSMPVPIQTPTPLPATQPVRPRGN